MDRRIDAAVALAFAAFGLFVVVEAAGIPQGMMRDPVGPRMAFYVCGGGIALGGLFLAARHLVAWRRGAGRWMADEGVADEPEVPASAGSAFLLVAACFGYALAFQPLGYLLATPLFIAAALAVLRERRWGLIATVAVGFTLVSYVTFAQALGVRVPVGPFTDLFRSLGWIVL
jgi:putative tricarboxylic transport membrane protein